MKRAERLGQVDYPTIEELIPHRGPVVLLARIVGHDGESTDAEVSIAGQRWLTREDGSVASWLAVEYMAQCVAAHEGLLAHYEGRPPPSGFLVGVTGLTLKAEEYATDVRLRVSARRLRGRPSLGALSHQCRLELEPRVDGGRVAESSGDESRGLLAEGRFVVSVRRDSAS